MIFSIGEMRHRINIVGRPQTPDTNDLVNYGFAIIATRWAAIVPKKGSKYLNGQQIDETYTHQVVIRYEDFVTSELFIQYNQQDFKTNLSKANDALITYKMFRVNAVKNIFQLQRFLVLDCEEYFET